MTGLGLILKQLGVNIDPKEIEKFFQDVRTEFPRIINKVSVTSNKLEQELTELKVQNLQLQQSIMRLESKLEKILNQRMAA